MKNFLSHLTLFTLLFVTACSKNEPIMEHVFAHLYPEMRFYGIKYPEISTRGAAQHDRCWHSGSTIKVKFLNGDTTMHQKVINYAKEWENYANITFKFVNITEEAHVRVGFDWNDNRYVTWSYIGTDCKAEVDQNEATLSFACFDYITEDTIRGDVLRAFGQVLGLELESRNINFNPQWATAPNAVQSYWNLFNINDVVWSILKKYVFDPLDKDNALSTNAYDSLSIMKWPFPINVLLNGAGTIANTILSEEDKRFIAMLYPKEEAIVTMVVDGKWVQWGFSFRLGVNTDYSVTIDWGNGNVEVANAGDYSYSHSYSTTGNKIIKIFGNRLAIYKIDCSLCFMDLDVSKNIGLKYLYCRNNSLSSLDVSNNPLLEELWCDSNQLASLDISNNQLLKKLLCYNNQLSYLDISNNHLLRELWCENNQLTSLDVSNTNLLTSLGCSGNQLSFLDISNNQLLDELFCDDNQLTSLNFSKNPLLSFIDCRDNQLSSLDLSTNNLLQGIRCQNNQLAELDFSNNPNIWFISCSKNTFIANQTSVVAFAQSLPDRTGMMGGTLTIGLASNSSWISAICAAKNWNLF